MFGGRRHSCPARCCRGRSRLLTPCCSISFPKRQMAYRGERQNARWSPRNVGANDEVLLLGIGVGNLARGRVDCNGSGHAWPWMGRANPQKRKRPWETGRAHGLPEQVKRRCPTLEAALGVSGNRWDERKGYAPDSALQGWTSLPCARGVVSASWTPCCASASHSVRSCSGLCLCRDDDDFCTCRIRVPLKSCRVSWCLCNHTAADI